MLGVVDFEQHELQYLDSIPISKTSPVSAHGLHLCSMCTCSILMVLALNFIWMCTHNPPTDRFNWDHWKKSVVVTVSPTFSLQYHVLSKFSQSGNNTTTDCGIWLMVDIQAIHQGLPSALAATETDPLQLWLWNQILSLGTECVLTPSIHSLLQQAGKLYFVVQQVVAACNRFPVDPKTYMIELDSYHKS